MSSLRVNSTPLVTPLSPDSTEKSFSLEATKRSANLECDIRLYLRSWNRTPYVCDRVSATVLRVVVVYLSLHRTLQHVARTVYRLRKIFDHLILPDLRKSIALSPTRHRRLSLVTARLTDENRSNRRKTSPSATLFTTNFTWTDLGSNHILRRERPATNRLKLGTVPRGYD